MRNQKDQTNKTNKQKTTLSHRYREQLIVARGEGDGEVDERGERELEV